MITKRHIIYKNGLKNPKKVTYLSQVADDIYKCGQSLLGYKFKIFIKEAVEKCAQKSEKKLMNDIFVR
jgi:hypothetical protein